MARRVTFGTLAIAVYLATFWAVSSGLPAVRPLYDGLAPPAPYRYVEPPSDLAADNQRPLPAVGTLILEGKGSRARQVETGDTQAIVVFPDLAFAAREDETDVTVRVTPLGASRLPQAPGELVITGNAYRVTAVYSRSKDPAELDRPATIVLRYPIHDSAMLRLDNRRWRTIGSQAAQASLQIFAETKALGTFATAGVPQPGRQWIAYAAAAAGVVAGAGGYLAGKRRAERRTKRPRKRVPRRARPR